ncbi:hypothetical protein MMC18_002036 [Xylographa bjoerkii]|nr:hypothetical protein [Xylographa bjoerkii]
MFSRLREFARSFFGRQVTVPIEPSSKIAEAKQSLQEELAVEAQQDMVTTRAQDHGLGEAVVKETVDGVKNGTKRKSNSAEINNGSEARSAAKRRRASHEKEADRGIEKLSPPRNMGDNLGSQSSEAPLQLSERSTVTSQSTLTDTTTFPNDHVSNALPPSPRNGDEPRVAVQPLKDDIDDTRIAATTQNGERETTTRSNMGKKRRKGDDVAHTLSNGNSLAAKSVIHSSTHGKDSRPEMKKATHKRFGSEEPQAPLDLPSNDAIQDYILNGDSPKKVEIESQDESEDDSPEVVTVSAGLTQARTAAAEAARAAETQSLARKEKRRARDAHLKEQAATSKRGRRSRGERPSGLDDATSNLDASTAAKSKPSTAGGKSTSKRTDAIPDFLPADVLAAEPVIHPPTPPRFVTIVNPRKRKFLDADPKPPKDLKRGSVTVRILEENKSTLPPRSSKLSKSLKESWLAGQRGRNDVASRRLKMGGGFVRK